MKISAGNLVKGINDFIFEWQKSGLVADSRMHDTYRRAGGVIDVTWGNDGYVLKDDKFASLHEYLNLIENRQYSMLLSEGDMFQFSFSLERGLVVKHRLCWYPCPVKVSREEIETSSLVDAILERMGSGTFDDLYCRTPIRFDFDSKQSSENHPAVHLHMNSEDCRIPVKTPLCLRSFIDFVLENFYSSIEGIGSLNKNAVTWPSVDLLTPGQKARLHINTFPACGK